MRYKALALDMDGTLLNQQGELEAQVITALKRAQEAGVGVYLVSGRMHRAMYPYWKELGLTTPLISYNGCRIMHPDSDKPLYEISLPLEVAHEVIAFAKERGLSLNTYYSDCLYTLEDNAYAQMYARINKVPYKILPDDYASLLEAPTKVLIIATDGSEPQKLADLDQEVRGLFEGRAHVTTSSRMYIEFLPIGANKASGLERMNEIVGLSLDDWVAVGDGMNDYEMLMECGVGLAVAGAPQELLQHFAEEFIVPDLPKGGIEKVLQDYFDIEV